MQAMRYTIGELLEIIERFQRERDHSAECDADIEKLESLLDLANAPPGDVPPSLSSPRMQTASSNRSTPVATETTEHPSSQPTSNDESPNGEPKTLGISSTSADPKMKGTPHGCQETNLLSKPPTSNDADQSVEPKIPNRSADRDEKTTPPDTKDTEQPNSDESNQFPERKTTDVPNPFAHGEEKGPPPDAVGSNTITKNANEAIQPPVDRAQPQKERQYRREEQTSWADGLSLCYAMDVRSEAASNDVTDQLILEPSIQDDDALLCLPPRFDHLEGHRQPSEPSTVPKSHSKNVSTSQSESDSQGVKDQAPITTPAGSSQHTATQIEISDDDLLEQLMNLAGQLTISKARFFQIGEEMKQIAGKNRDTGHPDDRMGRLKKLADELDFCARTSDSPSAIERMQNHVRYIRAEFERLHQFLRESDKMRSQIRNLFESTQQLGRISGDIQKCVMETRMVPLRPIFDRLKEIVRERSLRQGKHIRLEVHGETTQLDKRVIKRLDDLLNHVIGNSLEHGIEPPDQREAKGKPRTGSIILDASRRGNNIVVRIIDDGKGLDANKLRSTAVTNGIVSTDDAKKMSDQQIYQLILAPDFPAESGHHRSSGLKMVRRGIGEIGGRVEVDSTQGVGTNVTLEIPLTLAISTNLLVVIDHDVFAIPVEFISEIVNVSKKDLAEIHGLETAAVRDRIISIVRLSELFEWNQTSRQHTDDGDATTLVIVEIDGTEVGLVVHGLIGKEDIVIKALSENYQNVDGIAGASILGDGRVSLILDVAALLLKASGRGFRRSVATLNTSHEGW